jgi:hypothetical protein
MLLKLPVELIQRIVRLSTPEEITSWTYQPRQGTLRNLCLVNSLPLAIAQPVLEEALWVNDRERWERTAAQLSKSGTARLRFLWVNEESSSPSEWKDVEPFLPLLRSIRELRLADLGPIDLDRIAVMSSKSCHLSFRIRADWALLPPLQISFASLYTTSSWLIPRRAQYSATSKS